MHPVIAKLLVTQFATPAILAGTLALAAGGAAALSHGNADGWHHGCVRPAVQNVRPTDVNAQGQAFVAWACADRDGDGR
jgi:hypothetical protein